MANNVLNTRIVLCNDTSVTWASSDKVLLKGEMAIEFPESGAPKFKFGDGTNTFANLPYSAMTPDEVSAAIKSAVDAAKHSHSNKSILDAITASFTTQLKANYDKAYTHSISNHAPSNAQANVIEGVSVNGTKLTPNSKVVDVTVPTKVSQLQNDTGFITSYKDTKYTLGAPSGAANGNATIDITDSDKNKQSLKISGAGATKVTTDSSGNIVITSTDNNTVYSHPTSGVTAGTYKSVTVDNKGHVTAGTNPTTLSGYGITDTYTGAQIDSKISSAVANADHLKRTIVNALPSVDAADEHTIYMVAKASGAVGSGTNNGYDEYMLIVSGSTKKFEKIGDSAVDLTNYATKAYADQSEADALSAAKTYANGLAKNYATAAQGVKADSAVQSVKIGTTEYKSGTTVTLPAYPTTLPASDVSAWAKASTKPTYTWNEIGSKPSTFTPASHSHNEISTYGINTINSTANDTTTKWSSYNNSIHYYSNVEQLTDQPSQYGFLHNISRGEAEVHQVWYEQASGSVYHRGGNASGWAGSWRRFLDTGNYNSYVPTKTGEGASGTWKINITGKATTAGTADIANSVAWGNVSGKPSTYTPSSHTHTKSQITDFPTSMPANGGTADTSKISAKLQTYKTGSTTETYGNDFPVYAQWSSDNSKVNLKCDNYKVATDYATSAGSANSATTATTAKSATTATTASKLGTNAGSTTHPVYFANGVPVEANVSSDFLVQGSNTIVFDCGNASA